MAKDPRTSGDSRTSGAVVVTEQESSFTLSRGTRRTLTGLTAAGLGVDA